MASRPQGTVMLSFISVSSSCSGITWRARLNTKQQYSWVDWVAFSFWALVIMLPPLLPSYRDEFCGTVQPKNGTGCSEGFPVAPARDFRTQTFSEPCCRSIVQLINYWPLSQLVNQISVIWMLQMSHHLWLLRSCRKCKAIPNVINK